MKKGLTKKAAESPSEAKIDRFTKSPDNIKAIGGSGLFIWDAMVAERTALAMHPTEVNGVDERKVLAATAIRSFAPKDPVEAMLASQAAALHFASMECLRRAVLPNQQADVASKLRKDAANTARAMVEMCEALDRRRGKGPQVVRVERVVVNEGGQAVVGHVQAGAMPRALGESAAPIALPEGEPASVEGRGYDSRSDASPHATGRPQQDGV